MPEWIDTQEASELSGYHRDYVRQLARKDPRPFKAEVRGTMWWINKESFLNFVAEQRARAETNGRQGPHP